MHQTPERLSDPEAPVIRQYLMYNPQMHMAHMGYVLIDARGRVRHRVLNPQCGEHREAMLRRLARHGPAP